MAAPTITAGTLAVSTDAAAPYIVTPTLPTHAAGDILVVVAATDAASAATLSCSTSGWASIIAGDAAANYSTGYFWKRATSASETNPDIESTQSGGTVGIAATAFAISGAIATGNPFESVQKNGSPTSSTTPTSLDITTTGADRLAVLLGNITDNTSRTSSTPPTGWTQSTYQTSITGNDYTILVLDQSVASASTVPGVTLCTLTGAELWQVVSLAVLPVAAAQSITMQGGEVAVSGGQPTITPGPVALTMQAGSVVVSGGLHTIRPGPVGLTMQAGSVVVAGGLHTIVPGPVALTMQGGTVVVSGGLPAITTSALVAAMQAGSVVVTGAQPTISPGAVGLTMQAGSAIVSGGLPTIAPGPVTLTMQAGSAVIAGGLPTLAAGAVNIGMQAGSAVVAGGQPTISSDQSLTMQAGSAVVAGGQPTISGVPVAVALSAGSVVVSGGLPTVRAAVTVTMQGGTAVISGANPTIAGGIGPSPAPVITYTIEVQWDNTKAGDGSSLIIGTGLIGTGELWNPLGTNVAAEEFQGTYDDLSARAKRFSIDRGRSSISDPTFAGRAEVVLHDPSGIFNPANASSPIAGNVAPMRVIRITATYDGTDYVLFRGQLRRIAHRPSDNAGASSETVLTAEDYLLYLDRAERVVEAQYDLCMDAAIGTVLSSSGLPSQFTSVGSSTPSGASGGTIFIPGAGVGSEVTSLPLLSDLTLSNQGQLYAAREGHVTWKARQYRANGTAAASPLGTVSSSAVGLIPAVSLDAIKNRATVTRSGSVDGDNGGIAQTASDGDSLELYGVSATTISSPYLTSDAQAANLAEFIVAAQAEPANELQAVNLRSSDAATMRLMLDLDLNDPVVVIDRAAGTATYWVEGVKHESSSAYGGHSVVLTLSKVKTGLPSYSG